MRKHRALANLWGDSCERPSAALVIHDSTRAIDRVDDAFPIAGRRRRSLRKIKLALDALHHDLDRKLGRPVCAKPGKDRRLADPVHGVDRVSARMAGYRREACGIQMLPPREHGISYRIAEAAKKAAQRLMGRFGHGQKTIPLGERLARH